ncbi:MAG: hypothetical protein FJ184_12470 [Gammaproteobacteria bacterium]|nr:hypothetical protein [Gammaproteobacteria bacterium]
MTPDRSRLLIALLGALLAVRFAFLPWWEQQQAAIESLQVVTDRLDKSEAVIRYREQILASARSLEQEVAAVLNKLPESDDDESFRLSRQQQLTEKLQAAGLRLNVFDWTLAGNLDGASLRFSRFRLQSTGDIASIARFVSGLEVEGPSIIIRDLIVTPRNPLRDSAPGATVEFSVVADAYFRPRSGDSVQGGK